jgi:hypothetical protein
LVLSRTPIEDENSYEARQRAMETAGDDWIEDLDEQERERQALDSDRTPLSRLSPDALYAPRRMAVGEITEFRARFARPCFTCRKTISVGEMVRGRKIEGGWDLFHQSCPTI